MEKKEKKQKSFAVYYISIFILSFLFYGNSLKNGYSLDDNIVTSTNNSKHPLIERLNRVIAEDFFVRNEQREFELMTTDASFRYKQLWS